ncbi:MAG TPA: hypothetical protein DHW64_07260 [Chitinophagaceae bacterium]|nr:hypothetical protein [Chitinophagaceae bacterium]
MQPVSKKRYVLSNEYNNANNSAIAKYFVNDVPATIGDVSTSKIYGEDLEVSGTDVYVLASRQPISGGAFTAVIYKNGIELQSVPVASGVYYNCLAVSGNDIYLAGMEYPSNGVPKVIQWKNGTVTSITTNTGSAATDARPYDMTVVGNDVYIAGYETASASPYNRLPKYWKNGVAVTLNSAPGSYSTVHRIVVQGNDVFCAGQLDDKAAYWKNGVATTLSTESSWCYGIAVNGTDVHTAGAVATGANIYNAASWKNGTKTMLSNITVQGVASVYGIGVDGNDVYVIGSIPEAGGNGAKSVYWKNGVLTELPTVAGNNGYAYRIVIQ